MKKCSYCSGEIQDEAIKCKHCQSTISTRQKEVNNVVVEKNNNVVIPLILWIASSVLYTFVLNNKSAGMSISFYLGSFVASSIVSLGISGFICLLFKRFRNWRIFLIGAMAVNLLFIIIGVVSILYMKTVLNG